MKNKFYIYLITLFLFSCSESQVNIKDLNKNAGLYYYEEKPFTGKALLIEFDTIITEITSIVDGVVEGEFNSFYLNGNLKEKGVLVNGVKDGIWEEYFDQNGKISLIKNYQLGIKFGSWKKFDINGNFLFEDTYDSSGFISNSKMFYENGNLFRETSYSRGLITGNLSEYYKNGSIKFISKLDGSTNSNRRTDCSKLNLSNGYMKIPCDWSLQIFDEESNLIMKKSVDYFKERGIFFKHQKNKFKYAFNLGPPYFFDRKKIDRYVYSLYKIIYVPELVKFYKVDLIISGSYGRPNEVVGVKEISLTDIVNLFL